MRPIVTDRVAWSVGRSVCHTSEPCKNGWTDRDSISVEDSRVPTEPRIRWGSRSPMGRGNFAGKGRPIVKYRNTHLCKDGWTDRDAVWLWDRTGPRNRVLDGSPQVPRDVVMATNFGTKIGFVWPIATRLLVMEGVWMVGQQNADILPTDCN